MNKSLIPAIAKLLGVELGERFKLLCNKGDFDGVHFLDEKKGLVWESSTLSHRERENACILEGILLGDYSVAKLPWEPKLYERYYYPSLLKKEVVSDEWWGRTSDFSLKVLGMVYHTREEAKEHFAEDCERLTGKPLEVPNKDEMD